MFFPSDEANWAAIDGAMFIGWGSMLPGLMTFIAAVICVAVLVIGQRSEVAKAKAFDK
ncbi:hypothetical protein L0664_02295 [Octadecabacter sp. G9-8]|uniref:Uncharacterized protein n=1 Tax=Octadecabacter dasysiphoniae TaxID=2909341 RepID=A0ABS9CRM7_9RHOB|nr:hypothetical protein [Octadecabacter dasysiphoniae]MCF2869888.1 hypothetical protein [Octadecabacter dasysiphoniae]